MAKGYMCPECGEARATYDRGAYHCGNKKCGAVWWTSFDKPSAGAKKKGFECHSCGKQTTHKIAQVSGADIWRCSTCGSTTVLPASASASASE